MIQDASNIVQSCHDVTYSICRSDQEERSFSVALATWVLLAIGFPQTVELVDHAGKCFVLGGRSRVC